MLVCFINIYGQLILSYFFKKNVSMPVCKYNIMKIFIYLFNYIYLLLLSSEHHILI